MAQHYHFIYPHQLFPTLPSASTTVVLIEDPLFFYDSTFKIGFHKQKLVLHRASMKSYQQRLKKHQRKTHYIDYQDALNQAHFKLLNDGDHVILYDPTDEALQKRIKRVLKERDVTLTVLENPNFLTPLKTLKTFFETDGQAFLMRDFYRFQRQRLNVLMVGDKPLGGQYSFDGENRKKMPKTITPPPVYQAPSSDILDEAKTYVNHHFSDHLGEVEPFTYPYTRNQALKAMEEFFKERFDAFGPYQDAIDPRTEILFHARLSSSINSGLLDPKELVDRALTMDVPLASKEGFIRQIIGWREFMRAAYEIHGEKLRNANQHQHHHPLPPWIYQGNSGVPLLDDTLNKINRTAYSHHIERLMVIGNTLFMLEVDPKDVYRYFMTTHIDAYDWVMVPNVYAMSQHASSLITTKPYFSSSNYLLKMSSYKKGDWCTLYDALFYTFLNRHKEALSQNPRIKVLLNHLKQKDDATLAHYASLVEAFRS